METLIKLTLFGRVTLRAMHYDSCPAVARYSRIDLRMSKFIP